MEVQVSLLFSIRSVGRTEERNEDEKDLSWTKWRNSLGTILCATFSYFWVKCLSRRGSKKKTLIRTGLWLCHCSTDVHVCPFSNLHSVGILKKCEMIPPSLFLLFIYYRFHHHHHHLLLPPPPPLLLLLPPPPRPLLLLLPPPLSFFSTGFCSSFFFASLISFSLLRALLFSVALMYVMLTLQFPFTQILFALPVINDPPDSWSASSLIALRSVLLNIHDRGKITPYNLQRTVIEETKAEDDEEDVESLER